MDLKHTRSDSFDYDNVAMDSSVLGDQTMASLEERKPQLPPSYYTTTKPAPYAFTRDASAGRPTELAYVADNDDVSTLANDTVSDRYTLPTLFSKKTGRGHAQPSDLKNYQGYSNDEDGDVKGDIVDEKSSFKKVKYYIAAGFALFLIGAITALTLGFLNLKDQQESSATTQRAFDADQLGGEDWEWTFKPTQATTSPPTASGSPTFTPTTSPPSATPSTSVPSSSPSTSVPSAVPTMLPTPTAPTTSAPTGVPSSGPSISPSGNPTLKPTSVPSRSPSSFPTGIPSSKPTGSPSGSPTTLPTRAASASPTQAPTTTAPTRTPTTSSPTRRPTPAPTMTKVGTFQTIVGGVSPDVLVEVEQSGSPQKEAYDWLISDPEFYSYSADRLVQRYALAVFQLKTQGNRRRLALEYSNECNWFPPEDGSAACNGEGIRENIVIRNKNIGGTLPTEVYMLGNLKTLVFSNSMLFGILPDSIKGMKSLRVLDLSNNRLSGPIPEKIGDLKKIRILDLSNNAFSGDLPKNIGKLKDARQVILSLNLLQGTIPADIRKMKNLESLDLRNNGLSGTIPLEMTEMVKLQQLQLTENALTGVVESSFCLPLVDLATFSTDCQAGGSITCNCCTTCGSGATASSTTFDSVVSMNIQITEVDAPSLRGSSQQSPTFAETSECENKVEVIKSCYESGNDIRVLFTNCDAEGTDWIGLYHSNADPEKLGQPLLWLEACGSQACGVSKGHGSVYFDETAGISEGSYKAFLVRKGSHQSVAESGEILVQGSC